MTASSAVTIVAMTAASPAVAYFGTTVMAETLFAALLTGAPLMLTIAREARSGAWRRYAAAGLLAGACMLTRTAGIAVVAAGLGWLLARRRWGPRRDFRSRRGNPHTPVGVVGLHVHECAVGSILFRGRLWCRGVMEYRLQLYLAGKAPGVMDEHRLCGAEPNEHLGAALVAIDPVSLALRASGFTRPVGHPRAPSDLVCDVVPNLGAVIRVATVAVPGPSVTVGFVARVSGRARDGSECRRSRSF
jgi:hypothetical protein